MTKQLVKENDKIFRLLRKLDEIDRQLEKDKNTILAEIEIQSSNLREKLTLSELERTQLEREGLDFYESIQKELQTMELQLSLVNMETGHLYQEKKEMILMQLKQLRNILERAEKKRHDLGAMVLKNVCKHTEHLEDKIEGLQFYYLIESEIPTRYEQKKTEVKEGIRRLREDLENIPERLSLEAKDLGGRLKDLSSDIKEAFAKFISRNKF